MDPICGLWYSFRLSFTLSHEHHHIFIRIFFIAFVVWLLFSNQCINNNLIIISFGSSVFFIFIVKLVDGGDERKRMHNAWMTNQCH